MHAEEGPIEAVVRALARLPGAPMHEIATAAGVSRTTLHRLFGDRETMIERASDHVLTACAAHFDEAGIDGGPVAEAFDRLIDATVPLGQAFALIFSDPLVYRVPRLRAEIERQDQRFARYFARGQAEGLFRPDLPARWLSHAAGAQFAAIWWAIEDGHVGSRDAPRIVRATILGGIAIHTAEEPALSSTYLRR